MKFSTLYGLSERRKKMTHLRLYHVKLDFDAVFLLMFSSTSFASKFDAMSRPTCHVVTSGDLVSCNNFHYTISYCKQVGAGVLNTELFAAEQAQDRINTILLVTNEILNTDIYVTLYTNSKMFYDPLAGKNSNEKQQILINLDF